MRLKSDIACFCASLLMLWAVSAAFPGNLECAERVKLSVPIMKTSEIKSGMKGYGLTVFTGIKPVRFEVGVIDVLKNVFPKHDLILIKCSHPIIKKAHIIAGMSGSPIYIENKLIGALAYGWSFTKEPIAGVTPIEWMLEEMNEPETPARKSGGRSLNRERGAEKSKHSNPSGLKRLQVPFYISGMGNLPSSVLEKLRKEGEKHGISLMQGTGGSSAHRNIGADKLVPGAALGVSLMRGDIDFTGIGTVTHREANRIIAFGHPMLFAGQEVPMPVTTAYIHGVLPSQWTSFKFGSPSKPVGTLTQDRWPAVAGTLGRNCPMIPVTGTVRNPTNSRTETVNVEMINNRSLSPYMLFLSSVYLMLLEGTAWTDFAVDYSLHMEFEKHGVLDLKGLDMAWGGYMVYDPYTALSQIMNNPFEPVTPKKIEFTFKTIHKRIDARLQRAWFDQLEVQPGNEVKLHIQVHPYEGKPQEIVFPVKIPPHLDEGKYDIVVAGGDNWAVQMPTPPAESVRDIFTQLKMQYRPTTLVAVLELPTVGVGFKGKLFRQLPSSVFGTLVSSSSGGVSTFQDGIHFTYETPWYLTGDSQRLKIIVKQLAEE
mgnify:CR=1 FL=1